MADKNMEAQISVEFEEATSRQSLNSGDKINALWGKVKRWLTDLKTVAFSGSYNDLSDKPTIPTVGNGTVTIKQGGTNKGTFTMNQSGNTIIELTDNDTTYSTATQSTNGLMSAVDKVKLDGIDVNANYTVVDSELSDTSENPVQNKAIMAALSKKAAASHTHSVADISDFPEIPTGGGAEVIWGTYSGEGNIDLGVKPRAVIISQVKVKNTYSQVKNPTIIVTENTPIQGERGNNIVYITDNGFYTTNSGDCYNFTVQCNYVAIL